MTEKAQNFHNSFLFFGLIATQFMVVPIHSNFSEQLHLLLPGGPGLPGPRVRAGPEHRRDLLAHTGRPVKTLCFNMVLLRF